MLKYWIFLAKIYIFEDQKGLFSVFKYYFCEQKVESTKRKIKIVSEINKNRRIRTKNMRMSQPYSNQAKIYLLIRQRYTNQAMNWPAPPRCCWGRTTHAACLWQTQWHCQACAGTRTPTVWPRGHRALPRCSPTPPDTPTLRGWCDHLHTSGLFNEKKKKSILIIPVMFVSIFIWCQLTLDR